jgi:uncharacterized membrane protein (DUF2068 family)
MDWSLLGCGRLGHVTYAPDEPEVAAQLSATTAVAGPAWCCLRCASFVPGPAELSGPARDAPRVRRGLEIRSLLILRFFAVERFLRAILFFGLAVLLWRFKHSQHSIEAAWDRERPILRTLFRQLGFNIDHSKLVGLIQHALTLSTGALTLLAIGLAAYAAIEVVECVGLWMAKRWGEYFAMVATSFGLPLEIYDLSHKVTVTALIFLAVNLALVIYLVATKRLFGVRGGKHAYEARLRSDSIMENALAAAESGSPTASPVVAAATSALVADPAHTATPPVATSASSATPALPATSATSAPSGAAGQPATSVPPGGTASVRDAASEMAPPSPPTTPTTPAPAAAPGPGSGGEAAPDSTSPQPVGRHRAPSTPPATDSSP